MDQEKVYKDALELASTFRYREARENLLRLIAEKPDHIDALLLLGKVEYYLRLFPSSRKRFETVLTYNSANQAAYFGIEYYKERKKKFAFFFSSIMGVIIFAAAVSFLFFSLSSSFHQGLNILEKRIYKKLEVLESSLETYSEIQKRTDERIILNTNELKKLNELLSRYIDSSERYFGDTSGELEKLKEKMEALSRNQVELLNRYRIMMELYDQKAEE